MEAGVYKSINKNQSPTDKIDQTLSSSVSKNVRVMFRSNNDSNTCVGSWNVRVRIDASRNEKKTVISWIDRCNDCLSVVKTWMNVFFCCISARRYVSSLSGRHSLVWNVARELAWAIRCSNRWIGSWQRKIERERKGDRVLLSVGRYNILVKNGSPVLLAQNNARCRAVLMAGEQQSCPGRI